MKTKIPASIRKVVVAAVGLPLLVVGLILIPLPGPGVIITFAALFILSLEFEQVEKPLEKAREQVKQIYKNAKARADKIEAYGDKKK